MNKDEIKNKIELNLSDLDKRNLLSVLNYSNQLLYRQKK